MGLDVDLVKFKKAEFDARKDKDGTVDYHDGCKIHEDLGYWRKKYEIRDLFWRCSNQYGHAVFVQQCDFHPLSKADLEWMIDRVRTDEWDEDEVEVLNAFAVLLEKILAETNFETEQISYSWIS